MWASRPEGFDSAPGTEAWYSGTGSAAGAQEKKHAGGATTLFLFTAFCTSIVEMNRIVFELSSGPI